ncbi:hypothetical protein LZ30DRAFT_743667 [Colletotrichum cereale]|nr:hypothetical protein LZ30DRAFT_743667 [Colletotrichum cereale]
MPYSFRRRSGYQCRIIERSSMCKECVRRGRACNASGDFLHPLSKTILNSKGLETKEEAADELLSAHHDTLHRTQADLDDSLARLKRLRWQKHHLVTNVSEMNRLGLQSLDEFEAATRAESEAVIEVQSCGGVNMVDWNAMFGDAWGTRLSQTEEQVKRAV